MSRLKSGVAVNCRPSVGGSRLLLFALLGVGLLCLVPVSVFAHGTLGIEISKQTKCAAFSYDDEEPMNYAKATINAPEMKTVYQSAATDSNGIICFAPDRPGGWKIVAEDGMGHQQRLTIMVALPDQVGGDQADPSADNVSGGTNRAAKLIDGLCIIFGATGLVAWFRAKKRQPRT